MPNTKKGMFQSILDNLNIPNNNCILVNSKTGNNANPGVGSWDYALATWDAAYAKCSENNGDKILLAPGHSETFTTSGTKVTGDKAGVETISLGKGSDKATFTFENVDATMSFTAENQIINGVKFISGIDSIVTFATFSGAKCKMINCESEDAAGKEVIDAFIVTTDGKGFKAEKHKHTGDISSGDANESIFNLTDVSDFEIKDSLFITKAGTGVIELPSTAKNGLIDNCIFYVDGTSDLSLNIVDSDNDSTIAVRNCFDLEAMSNFSGGNNGDGFSVAGDDIGALNAKIGTISNTNGTATLGAILGNMYAINIATRLIDAVKKTTIADGTTITNNTQVAAGLLATAVAGDCLIEEIGWNRGATNFTGPTNLEFTTDNVSGATGVDSPIGVAVLAKFNANTTNVLSIDGTTKQLPFILESGKKLYIHGDNAAVGAGGSTDLYIKYKRMASNAYLG